VLADVHVLTVLHMCNNIATSIDLSHTLILDLPVQVPIREGPKLQYGFLYCRHFQVLSCLVISALVCYFAN